MKETKLKKKLEEDKKERNEKKRKLEEKWALLRWITNYIETNNEKWEKGRKERQEKGKNEVLEWERKTRFEKVAALKEKERARRTEAWKMKNEGK